MSVEVERSQGEGICEHVCAVGSENKDCEGQISSLEKQNHQSKNWRWDGPTGCNVWAEWI